MNSLWLFLTQLYQFNKRIKSTPHKSILFLLKLSSLRCLTFNLTDDYCSATCMDGCTKCLTLSFTCVSDSGHPSCHGLTAGAAANAACAKVLKCHVLQAEIQSDNFRKFVHTLDRWIGRKRVHGYGMSELFKPKVEKCEGGMSGLWKKLDCTVLLHHQQQQRGCSECYQVLHFDRKS